MAKKNFFEIFNCLSIFLLIAVVVGGILACEGCNQVKTNSTKEFLFEHQEIKVRFDGNCWYDYLTDINLINSTKHETILSLLINNVEYEILLDSTWKKIGNTNYYVSIGGLGHIWFKTKKPKPKSQTKLKQESKKEEVKMSLSLGTWIMLIIVMLIIAKVAHKISLKTIFKPTKKTAKYVKKEWDES